jgi:hypothetical protein
MSGDEFSSAKTRVIEAPEPPGELAPGTLLFGAYEIVGLLGSGGMGAVYSARHLRLGGMRAVKVMHPELITKTDLLERFYREARALLQVHHDAVVRCHDLLEDERRVYLVMELVDGISLSHRMRDGQLSEAEVIALGTRLASGLAAAHAVGVVHRDLSPDNIVLPEGRPELAKIIDFGIAKVLKGPDKTMAGGFKGKLSYASPEQLGLYGGVVDQRSDLYSLGLVLTAAALGAPLDMGHQIAESISARTLRIELPPAIPPRLKRGIEALLVADPKDRVPSAEAFLELWRGGGAAPKRRRAILAPLLLLIVLAIGLATTVRFYLQEEAEGVAEEVAPVGEHPIVADFASLREWLLRARGNTPELRPKVRIRPDPVPDGTRYSVILSADCKCSALVFEVDGSSERIGLLYPNPYEPATPLEVGRERVIPSSTAYALEAVKGKGTDRLRLIVVDGPLEFPPPDLRMWETTPGHPDRLAELSELISALRDRSWASAGAMLLIAP